MSGAFTGLLFSMNCSMNTLKLQICLHKLGLVLKQRNRAKISVYVHLDYGNMAVWFQMRAKT